MGSELAVNALLWAGAAVVVLMALITAILLVQVAIMFWRDLIDLVKERKQ